MKHKSETFEKFKEFQSEVESHRNKKIKFLRSNRGREYLSYELGLHLKQCGIVSQLTPLGTAHRNGVSKRCNRTLLDIIHTDVCGPMSVEALGGYRYFLTFTDDSKKYGYIYLMKQESEKHLKSSYNFRVKQKIIVTRK